MTPAVCELRLTPTVDPEWFVAYCVCGWVDTDAHQIGVGGRSRRITAAFDAHPGPLRRSEERMRTANAREAMLESLLADAHREEAIR